MPVSINCKQFIFPCYNKLYLWMSRGNVFKLSGNNVLGGGDYHSSDLQEIKNSLKLLKAKRNQRNNNDNLGYNGVADQGISNKNYFNQPKNDYNYDALTKNHLPSSQRDFSPNFNSKNYNDEYGSNRNKYGVNKSIGDKNYQQGQSYDYRNSPSYQRQKPYQEPYQKLQNVRKSRNIRESPSISNNHSYESDPYYQKNYNKANQRPSYPPRNQIRQPQISNRNQYYNDREERNIKEVNRQNQAEIVIYDPSELRVCRMGCGRKFNPQSIVKHEANCKKVFQKKRKQFDSQKHRVIDKNQNKFMKQGERAERKIEQIKKTEKLPKWKADSIAFRAQMKQNRGAKVSASDQAMLNKAEQFDRVQCRFCGRKFNSQAAQRHIKFCEEQTRKNAIKNRK